MNEPSDPHRPGPSTPAAGGPPAWWGWAVVAALIAVEVTMFVTYARREVVWAYPGNYDQPAYLTSTYTVGRDAAAHGLPGAARMHLARPHAAGVLLPLQAAVHGVILGPGRLGALTVNFAYLALFQCALAGTLFWLTRNWWVALAGFGLTLTLKTVFLPAGGAFDFRIDFVSFCLFGVFLCALVRSRGLLTARGSAAVGAVAAVLVLFRFIAAVYLAGIFGVLGAALLAARWAAVEPEARRRAAARLRGWAVALTVVAVATGPFLYKQRATIKAYYVGGHITSSEKDVRAAADGLHVWVDAAAYYPRSVARDHTGPAFWWAAGAVCGVGLLGLVGAARGAGARAGLRRVVPIAVVGLAVPLGVLTAHTLKSPVVGVVLLPPLVLLAVAPLAATARVWAARPWVLRGAAGATLLCGFVTQLSFASAPGPYAHLGDDGPRTMRAMADLGAACDAKGLSDPVFFTDSTCPDFQTSVVQLTEFETTGRWRDYRDGGISIFAGEEEEHVRRVTRADLVVLGGVPTGYHKYPYDEALEKVRPRLRAYCDANLTRVGEYRLGGRVVTTYVRGHLRVEGVTADGWVTDQGVRLVGTLADLKNCRRVELRRVTHPNYLGRTPGVTAELTLGDRPPRPLAAAATADLAAVRVEWVPVDLPADTPVTVHVRFDATFSPRERGTGDDPRRLVMSVGPRPRTHLVPASGPSAPKE